MTLQEVRAVTAPQVQDASNVAALPTTGIVAAAPDLTPLTPSSQTDNAAAINAALQHLAPGETLTLPPGTYGIASPVQLDGRNLAGTGVTLVPLAPMATMIAITGGFSTVSGLTLLNTGGLSATGIAVTKSADNLPVSIEGNTVQGFARAIALQGDDFSVYGNSLAENSTGIYLGSYTLNGRITGNHIAGGVGIDLEGGDQQPEGVDISGNVISTGNSAAVLIRSGLAIQVTGNTITQLASGQGVVWTRRMPQSPTRR